MSVRETFEQIRRISGYPCVSILLPTHRTAPENYQDAKVLKNLAQEASERLLAEFEEREVKSILDNLSAVQDDIDHQFNKEGLLVYVSEGLCRYIRVSIPVEARVVIDRNFATRPLIQAMNSLTSYYCMTLSEGNIRLLECNRDRLHEVHAHGFPMANKHHHVSQKMRTIWTKEEDEQMRDFFREVDAAFEEVLRANPMRLVLVGSEHALDNYRHVSRHQKAILTSLVGNFDNTPAGDLGKLVWPVVAEAVHRHQEDELLRLNEARAGNKVALGLAEVYATATEGRGDTLVVEEDFFHPARIVDGHLDLLADREAPGVVDDIVDEIAETVMSMGGRVVFLEEGMLQAHGSRIAMALRY